MTGKYGRVLDNLQRSKKVGVCTDSKVKRFIYIFRCYKFIWSGKVVVDNDGIIAILEEYMEILLNENTV